MEIVPAFWVVVLILMGKSRDKVYRAAALGNIYGLWGKAESRQSFHPSTRRHFADPKDKLYVIQSRLRIHVIGGDLERS